MRAYRSIREPTLKEQVESLFSLPGHEKIRKSFSK
jgi:hypothetical protein